MRLCEIMDSRIMTVSVNDYAASALSLMRLRRLSKALVLDRDDVVGVLLRQKLENQGETALKEHDVRENMQTNLLVVSPDVHHEDAERLLRIGGLECLVVKEHGRVQGTVTTEELAQPGRDALHGGRRRRVAS